ncbi:MAG TPA: hypothetical protein VKG43_06130 [Acidimicrobiales bacterium]|nr:hypothetical protein [Acidimicrobiales bacterium]
MIVWIIMAVVLVLIVAGAFGGRRYQKSRSGSAAQAPAHKTHHKSAKNHRGRGSH